MIVMIGLRELYLALPSLSLRPGFKFTSSISIPGTEGSLRNEVDDSFRLDLFAPTLVGCAASIVVCKMQNA
jgi:hypothetical protein